MARSRARLDRLLDGILGTIEALREQEERNERLLASQGEAAERSMRQLRLAAQLAGELAPTPVPCEA
ncbi:MAG: hypothetical protein FJ291_22845 [Planctomycetes bacterium]|nr:hypothetical protein [Planctomycetota bacterium]